MMTEKLFVEFCQGEKEARKDKIIEELEQIERWEDAKSAATKHYNEMIKESDLRIKDLRAELSAGGTEEDVEVCWKMDDPEKGKKALYRMDTMERIRIEEMGLFDGAESSEPDPPTPEDLEDGEPVKLKPAKTVICNGCGRCDGTEHICARCEKPAEYYMQLYGEGCVCEDCFYSDEQEETPDKTDKTDNSDNSGEVCCKCGSSYGNGIYHISDGPICRNCVINRNHKKYVELNERMVKVKEAGRQLLFRESFGYGVCSDKADMTCFRFRDHEHSWGLDIYEPGRVTDETSAAWKLYDWLLHNGAKED